MAAPHWLSLPVLPWRTAEVAARMDTRRVMNVGAISLILLVALPLGAAMPSTAEPFADMGAYVEALLTMGPLGGLIGAAIFILPVWIPFFLVADLAKKPSRPWRARVTSRVLLLNHLCLVVPVLMWLPFLAMAPLAHRSFGLGTPKPTWVFEPWLQQVASALVPAAMLLLWFANLGIAWLRIQRMPEHVMVE